MLEYNRIRKSGWGRMFLKGLQVVNFRNFKGTEFTFEQGANTIIGENDSGKSNAMTALRILLDSSFYYNTKRLKESDFSRNIVNGWKGHWIIISALFSNISEIEKENEACVGILANDEENTAVVNAMVKNSEKDFGVVSLFIRPQFSKRKELYDAREDKEKFENVRNSITTVDYEFYFTSRSNVDFCNIKNYEKLVGNFETLEIPNPEDEDRALTGTSLNIGDFQNHVSVVFIDALRDVSRDMHNPTNPIRRIIEVVETRINPTELDKIKGDIAHLNESIARVSEISQIGIALNNKLIDIIGMVYSPDMKISSELSDKLKSLSKYIAMKSGSGDDMELLGLGHLNMLYIALKIIEFETCRTRELLNVMIIEEPEAHIHAHIQKTLFDNLKVSKDYTQILMTSHSAHLAEASQIQRMNVLKCHSNKSIAMQPSKKLNDFGNIKLKKSALNLTKCVERYLDTKRSILMFSKGVILVEGDGEEILIPSIINKALGVSLDEIGIGLINIGSTAFEYIASLFGAERIQRYCAIVTDLDKQAISKTSKLYKEDAEKKGQERKEKLDDLFNDNLWVFPFYAEHTLEVEFINSSNNYLYVQKCMDKIFVQKAAIQKHKDILSNISERNEEILSLAKLEGKGWMAILISNELDDKVDIPDYILHAVAFAGQESIDVKILFKMVEHAVQSLKLEILDKQIKGEFSVTEKVECIKKFIKTEDIENNVVYKFLQAYKNLKGK